MGFYVLCFILGVVVCYFGLTYKEGHSTDYLKRLIDNQETRIIVLQKQYKSNNEKQDSMKLEMEEIRKKSMVHSFDCEKLSEEIDGLSEYCEKIKLSQIDLQDKLSNKRPVLKVSTPIPVQIVEEKKTGKGVESLIKKAGIKK